MSSGIPSFRALVLALGIVMAAAGTGEVVAATLYGAAHVGAAGASTLHQIHPATGVATAIGPIGFEEVGGLAFHPDGRLYGVGKRSGPNTWVLIRIDPDTGAGTEVGRLLNTVAGSGHYDLSFHSDGTLYLTADSLVNPCVSLFTVDLATGEATEVGDTTVCSAGNALAFSRIDILRHANIDSGGTLYTVDTATGASAAPSVGLTHLGFPVLVDPRPNAIDVDRDTGVSYVSVDDGTDGSGPNYLATLDPVTGDVTHVGLTVNGLEALAWRPTACVVTLYATASPTSQGPSDLYRLRVHDAVWTHVGPIGFNRVGSMDFHPVNGLLYGVAQRPSDGTTVLIRINPISGKGTEIGELVNSFSGGGHFDVSFRGSDDTLFLTAFPPGGTPVTLFTIDIDTGVATEIGSTTTDSPGNALAFSRNDTLYHVDNIGGGTLYTVDQATGASTSSTTLSYINFGVLVNPTARAMDFNPADNFAYVVINDKAQGEPGPGPQFLATLDPSTGIVANIDLSIEGMDGLAWRTDCSDHDVCTDDRCKQCDPADCAASCTLFGSVHLGSDGLSTLYRIDPATGAATPIGPIGFERVGSIDFHADGTLYGVGERDDVNETPILISIDPLTGAGKEIGPLITSNVGGGHFDMSFRNFDGALHQTAFNLVGGDIVLYTLSLVNGFATQIGDMGVPAAGNALAFAPDDTLYHANVDSGGTLYIVDQVTGVSGSPTLLNYPVPPLDAPTQVAMDFDPCSGVLLAAIKNGLSSAAPIYLATIDPSTGDVAVIGQTATGLSGLAGYRSEAGCCHTPLTGPVPFPHTLFATAADRFDWYLAEDVVMVKGDLSALSTYGTSSTASFPAATFFTDATVPVVGSGFYYLLKGDCTQAIWSSGGAGECAGPDPCPAGGRDGNLP